MSDMNTPTPEKRRRWLGPALLVSLAVNLFLLGLISVPLIMGPPDRGGPRGSMHGLFHESFRDLPEGDRAAIRKVMIGHFPAIRPHLRSMRDAKSRLSEALAAEPYDEATVRAAFDDMDAAMREMTAIGQNAMMAGFAQLTPEQRRRVAEAMRESENRRHMKFRFRDGADRLGAPPAD
ncbi:conserved hypothetical protein [Parvibaculum lavamentivorans DS-1]|uniref:Zinc resistance-associated protein n=1 Tax=Parvibaculum lavamentivorans (strain DS-1 / DSM 13023 / NCIMB 13966) TaxID=402881 RepID=A7HRP3_PARL1|nr:periplasmic heavy metal sensor [Parvibaculum lavamentivorans]ABS62576.1 conserved hypothetical protein [Parvibaculum lavamentivorans DS-1]